MMIIRTCFSIALFSWSASIANAADYIAPKGVTLLTEEQLMAQVIGSTYMGGTIWVEYYQPSTGNKKEGRIKGKHRIAGLYGGNWKISGSLMCWKFDDPKLAVYNDCFTTSLDGDTVTSYTIRGIVHTDPAGTIKLISGNPKKL